MTWVTKRRLTRLSHYREEDSVLRSWQASLFSKHLKAQVNFLLPLLVLEYVIGNSKEEYKQKIRIDDFGIILESSFLEFTLWVVF